MNIDHLFKIMQNSQSPGYGDCVLAVSELKSKNYSKSISLFESSISKDPTLTISWIGKVTVVAHQDISTININNFRCSLEQALNNVRCSLEQALNLSPNMKNNIILYFLENIYKDFFNYIITEAIIATFVKGVSVDAVIGSDKASTRIISGIGAIGAHLKQKQYENEAEYQMLDAVFGSMISIDLMVISRNLILESIKIAENDPTCLEVLKEMINKFLRSALLIIPLEAKWLNLSTDNIFDELGTAMAQKTFFNRNTPHDPMAVYDAKIFPFISFLSKIFTNAGEINEYRELKNLKSELQDLRANAFPGFSSIVTSIINTLPMLFMTFVCGGASLRALSENVVAFLILIVLTIFPVYMLYHAFPTPGRIKLVHKFSLLQAKFKQNTKSEVWVKIMEDRSKLDTIMRQ